MAAFLIAGVRLGTRRPAVDAKVSSLDVVEAHRHFEKRPHAGKEIGVTVS
ncbi:hypothetical protein ACIQGZ_22810 [Streptomyces sp. NPDC092296]